MKKNGFLEGAMISTIGIVLCKIIGVVYVIPFYSIIGKQGGALYSYAYSIYAIFLSLSSSGIPVAISKIISEYHTLGYEFIKEKSYKIGKILIFIISTICFIILFIFSSSVAKLIVGDIEGGNSISSVTMVIRVISVALLIVPLVSVSRGYLQGHKFMTASSISNVIEQLSRVIFIIIGSFFAIKILNLSLDTAVGIAVFGATIGALSSYIYILFKIKKNKKSLNNKIIITTEEYKITTKDIVKKIVFYAFPFIVIDLIKSSYSMIDTFTVVKTMNNLGYSALESETAIGVMTTWASKLNKIVISIATGLTISLIPNIASSYVKKDLNDVLKKINKSLNMLLVTVLPMAVGIFLLAKPIWIIFYGYDEFSINIFKLYIFGTITFSFFTVLIDIMQTMNHTKLTFISLTITLVLKIILNTPSMYLCDFLKIGAYYGPILVTLIVQALALIIILIFLKLNYNFNFKEIITTFLKVLFSIFVMIIPILIMKKIFINGSLSRIHSLIEIIIYSIVGFIFYVFSIHKIGLIKNIFNKKNKNS